MADPDLRSRGAADAAAGAAGGRLDASLVDLGRRLSAARADADRRASAPPSARRPFPVLWVVALVLVVAVIAGGLALASTTGDGADDLARSSGAGAGGAAASQEAGDAVASGRGAAAAGAGAAGDAAATASEAGAASATVDATTGSGAVAVPGGGAPGGDAAVGTDATAAGAALANAPDQTVRELTVVTGDSFWSIAEREVSAQLGRPATDAEITGWWADLLAANADRLVEPGNPNLLLPGQLIVTPSGVG